MSDAIREYSTLCPADYTVITVHATAPGTAPGLGGHTITLAHHTAGYEPAGSCARYVKETWRVTYTNGRGQRHGWCVDGFDHTGNCESLTGCDNCDTILWEES